MRVPRSNLLIVIALLAGLAAHAEEPLKSGVFEPPRPAPAFTLQGSNGAPLSLAQFHGKVVVLGWGYTHCHAVCPITLANLAAVFSKLGDDAREVQVLYITVDPDRDDAARMRDYLAHFNPTFLGGTGTPAVLAAMRQEYGITANKLQPDAKPTDDYDMFHSSFIYLIDRAGNLRALVTFGKPVDDIVHDLRILVKEH